MASNYPPLVRQDGFQLPSPTHTATTSEPTSPPPQEDSEDHNNLFMPHNISFLPEPFRKFPSAAQAHAHHQNQNQQIDFADELAGLIDSHPHASSHERSTHSRSPHDDQYRHNIFDISAPAQHHHQDIYQHEYAHFNSTLPALNSSMRYEPHPDPPPSFAYRHSPSPTHRSRSRSRGPSVGPTRSARRERRTNSISSHVSSTSPPPRPHPHAIVIPGRTNPMGGFFVPNSTSQPQTEYSLPTPDSLSHSFSLAHSQHSQSHPHQQQAQYPYAAPSSPYYPYQSANRASTPSMGISPTDVETLSNISLAHHLASSAPVTGLASSMHPSSLPTKPAQPTTATSNKSVDPDTHLSEKRRRRRESHNAVERRRRDNINERIGELAGLIPGVLFECDGPLVVPGTTPPGGASAGLGSGTNPNLGEDLFTIGLLGVDSGMHVLPADDGLPDLPEEASGMVKKDPSEESEGLTPASPTVSTAGTNGANGNAGEQTTIKANKGMILRKSVEYIRYLQQLVSVQATRGRDLEERNRALERELAALRGEPVVSRPTGTGSMTSASSISPSESSNSSLSVLGSASSKPSSIGSADREGVECVEDLEMEDGDHHGDGDEHDEPSGREEDSRGRRLGRTRESGKAVMAGRGDDEVEEMDI